MFPAINLGVLERYRVRAKGEPVRLAQVDPKDRQALPFAKEDVKMAMQADIAEIDRLQDILYAQGKHALLVALQGMDASGKDGTIRKVFGPINPLGTSVTNFKKPTQVELAHDFLWRIHKAVPPARMIGIFNRSHYEDAVVVRVHRLMPADRIEARYRQIDAFERHLAENEVTILKFFLHISKETQKRRLEDRLNDPTKRWKLDPDDLRERAFWDDYMAAYELALARCSTECAPWFIVPADRKWYRNAVVARIVRSTLEAMDLSYPPDKPGLDKIRIE